jgi:hypothetical protein
VDTQTPYVVPQWKQQKERIEHYNKHISNGQKENDILILYKWFKHKQNNKGKNSEKIKNGFIFTYTRNYIRKIIKLFKDTNLEAAFKTTTTIGKLLSDTNMTNTYEQCGIYKMTCQSCHKIYIGRMGQI